MLLDRDDDFLPLSFVLLQQHLLHRGKRLKSRNVLLLVGLQYLLGDLHDALVGLISCLRALLVSTVVCDEGLFEICRLETMLLLQLGRAALPVPVLEPIALPLRILQHPPAGHGV